MTLEQETRAAYIFSFAGYGDRYLTLGGVRKSVDLMSPSPYPTAKSQDRAIAHNGRKRDQEYWQQYRESRLAEMRERTAYHKAHMDELQRMRKHAHEVELANKAARQKRWMEERDEPERRRKELHAVHMATEACALNSARSSTSAASTAGASIFFHEDKPDAHCGDVTIISGVYRC